MSKHAILCGDFLKILPTLPPATMIFADPPDNLGVVYDGGVSDQRNDYLHWLLEGIATAALLHDPKVFWLSINHIYLSDVLRWFGCWRSDSPSEWQVRLFLWRFTFGQHRNSDFGNGYRPILRFSRPGTEWYTDSVRVPSARQTKYHDKRASAEGRVPDDVWDFPRVCGTFHERRPWHPNQHPEALMERIIKVSCREGDDCIDLFGGTFTTDRVCRRLGVSCTSIEISPVSCQKYQEELSHATT